MRTSLRRLLIVLLLLPILTHSIFHLLDWIVWGLGGPSTGVRELLGPFFQDATPLGLTVHAGVNVATLVLILGLWLGRRSCCTTDEKTTNRIP